MLPRTQLELTRVVLRRAIQLVSADGEGTAGGGGGGEPMPVLYELLSWLRNELPILLQRLACVPTPQPEAPEEEAEPDAETLQVEATPKLRGEAYARHCAQSARHRGAMELAAQREREEAEEEERRLRWEKVRSIIKAEELSLIHI